MLSGYFVVAIMSSYHTLNILPCVSGAGSASFLALRTSKDAPELVQNGAMEVSVDAQGRVFAPRRGLRGDAGNESWYLMIEKGTVYNQADVTIDEENRPVLLSRDDIGYGKHSGMDQGI